MRDLHERVARCRMLAVRAAVVATALVLAACSGPDEQSLIASTRDYLAKNDLEAARLQLKTLLQKNPDSAVARHLLGKVLLETGDPAGAEVELRRALEGDQPATTVLPLLASSLVSQGKGALLLKQFGVVTLPDARADSALKVQLAIAMVGENDLSGARGLVDQALRQSPDHLPALLLSARLTAAEGDTAGALKEVDSLLARQSGNADAWLLKGDLLLRGPSGQRAADVGPAVAAFEQALKAKPDSVAAHVALITLHLGRNDWAAAGTQWAALQKVAPRHPQTMYFEALLAEQKGDHKRTRELTQQLLRAAPNDPRLLLLAGQAELKLGSLAQAEALFAKAVQVAPKAPAPRRQLAQVQLRGGQADKALATLRPLVDANPPDPDALSLTARAQMMKGDSAAADASLAKASQLRPDDPRLRTAAALSSLAKGRDAAAIAELRAIAASDKGSTADLALINVLVRQGDLPGAAKAVDALAVKLPDDALPDQLRGRIALQRKDSAGARKAFEAALAKNADYLPAAAGLAALDLADKQPAAARSRFAAILARNPDNAGAMMALAEIGARNGDKPEQTAELLARAVKADPSQAAPRLALIDLYLGSGQLGPAREAAQAGVTALPDNADLLDRLGRAQLASGRTAEAISSFTKLATLAPRSALPQLRLADAQAAAKNSTAMAAAVRRAAEIAPDTPLVQQAQVNLALMENKPDQALAVARKVQTQRPDDAAGYSLEGDIELRLGHWDAAAVALRKALTRKNPGDSALRLHGALMAAKKTAEADKLAADWRKSHPDDLGFVLHLGDMAMAGGRNAEAETLYAEVLARQPDNTIAMNNQAYVLALQKKPGAVALAEQALKRAPKSPAVMDTLAFTLAADQQLPRAIEVQAQAVAAAPDSPQFRLQLARLQLQAGDKTAARTELDKLAKLGPAFPRQAEVTELLIQAGA
ncbi:MAG: PEP-CTERM system TPR-repeat protein PrsT [Burkholderiaceae bacterium]|nr:PEP-CTERM system TPR-repeat protein PrsT [Burkholderiaceae bacterium]